MTQSERIPNHPSTPEEAELMEAMLKVETALNTLLNGDAKNKQPWVWAFSAYHEDHKVFTMAANIDKPDWIGAMFLEGAKRLMQLTDEDMAHAKQKN